MAYCRNCGRLIPDGGRCSCMDTAPAIVPAGKTAALPEDTGFWDRVKASRPVCFMTDHLRIIIAAFAALIFVIIILVYVINHTGARGAARSYAKLLFSKSGGSRYYSMTLPDDLYKSLSGDKLDSMVDEFNDEAGRLRDDFKIKLKKVNRTSRLKGSALDGAEILFARNAAVYDKTYRNENFKAKKGYIFTIKYKVKDKQTRKTTTYTKQVAVVKFKGEGWKIVEADIGSKDSLTSYLREVADEE